MKKLILNLAILLSSSLTYAAYFQADLKSSTTDETMGTHIIIAGKGLEVGDQWLTAAHTQAMIFAARQKHGRIRLISAIDDMSTYNKKITTWGYQNISVFQETMTGSKIVKLIVANQKIASIDFVGHNGAFLGFALENYTQRFFLPQVDQLKAYKSQFAADSYIRIMGCNTGWQLAPYMAQTLGVPASGTFTFADIQAMFTPNTWFFNDVGRYPEGSKKLSLNSISFAQPTTCNYGGGCLRLKIVEIAYQGKHGTYQGTLPFAKYFCGSLDTNSCARRAALSMKTMISESSMAEKPTLDQYSKVVAESMCSSWKDVNRRAVCQNNVIQHLKGTKTLAASYNPIDEKALSCNFKACSQKITCAADGTSCVMEGLKTATPSTTFTDEVNFYKLGFSLL